MLEEGFNVVTINPVSEKVSILSCYDQTHGFAFTCLVPLPFESYDAQLSNVSLVPAQNYNSAYKRSKLQTGSKCRFTKKYQTF